MLSADSGCRMQACGHLALLLTSCHVAWHGVVLSSAAVVLRCNCSSVELSLLLLLLHATSLRQLMEAQVSNISCLLLTAE